MNTIEVDGSDIRTAADFHAAFARSPLVPSFYGRNLSALWDALTGLIELPLTLVWRNAATSKHRLGDEYEKIVQVMRKAEGRLSPDRFEIRLID